MTRWRGSPVCHFYLLQPAFRRSDLKIVSVVPQDKLYAYVSLGGRHQNTSLNTTDTQSPSWSDTLTFEHPTSEHTDISVAVYAKHTLLPDTLVGSAGKVESICDLVGCDTPTSVAFG